MRVLMALTFLSGCIYVRRPIDIVKPGPIYCQSINEDVEICRDSNDRPWHCEVVDGRWYCDRISEVR